MCPHMDALQTTVILCEHVVLALGNSAFDVGIFFHIAHDISLLSDRTLRIRPGLILSRNSSGIISVCPGYWILCREIAKDSGILN